MSRSGRRACAVALLALATACTRGAPSGRLDSSRVADDDSLALAARAVAQYRLRVRPSTDTAMTARAARVGQAIIDAAKAGPAGEPAGRLAWQIVVVESPNTTVATFANGTIFVDAGIVRALPTDDALAAALGQAVARILLWQGADSGARRARNGLAALAGMIPSSRQMSESERARAEEADYAGLVLAIEAGYDLDRALEVFDRLGLKERGERARERAPELREVGVRKTAG
jgi:predicted Zn-dependent protease